MRAVLYIINYYYYWFRRPTTSSSFCRTELDWQRTSTSTQRSTAAATERRTFVYTDRTNGQPTGFRPANVWRTRIAALQPPPPFAVAVAVASDGGLRVRVAPSPRPASYDLGWCWFEAPPPLPLALRLSRRAGWGPAARMSRRVGPQRLSLGLGGRRGRPLTGPGASLVPVGGPLRVIPAARRSDMYCPVR
jgi:hypothetical protein